MRKYPDLLDVLLPEIADQLLPPRTMTKLRAAGCGGSFSITSLWCLTTRAHTCRLLRQAAVLLQHRMFVLRKDTEDRVSRELHRRRRAS